MLCLTCLYQNEKETYAGNSDNYLVLVQQKDGSWKEYKNLIELSNNGNLMMKAKLITKALGFSYKNNSNGTFAIKRSSTRYNTYTKNTNKYIYTNESTSAIKLTMDRAYISERNKCYICQVNTLSTLVNYKYFDGTGSKSYTDYKGVLCFSKYKEIPASVPSPSPKPTVKPTPTPIPEPTTLSIEGIKFSVRDKFLSANEALSDWGGTMNTWLELETEVDGNVLDTTDLFIASNKIEYTHYGSENESINLSKASDGYKLLISMKLNGSAIAEHNAAIVKAMIVTISSKPTLVYTAIFESFTSDNTHGIKKGSYVTIGDCKIKIAASGGKVIYYIKKA